MGGRSPGDCGRLELWTVSERREKGRADPFPFSSFFFAFGREQNENKPRTMRELKKKEGKVEERSNVFEMKFEVVCT